MVGSWTALGLFLAASCLSARGAPLAPGAQGTFPPGAFGCGARQDRQAQVQATGGLEAGLGQSWSEECPSVPRLASSSAAPVPAAEVTAAEGEGEGEGEGVATIARGDSTRLVKSVPETAARDKVEEEEVVEEQDDGIQEGLVQEETGEAEAEARGQATLTTTTTTTSATSKAATTSATAQSSAEERQRGSAPVTSVPSDNTEEKRVSWLENGHRDAAEPGDQVAEEEEEEEEEDEGEGVALLHAASLTASPATDGQRSRAAADAAAASDTAFATVPPSAKPAMPMATPPSGGPSGRKTDGWGVAQMAQQSGDPAQAGGQAERGQQPGSATLTPDMTRGAAPEGHGGGGYEGGWEAAATQAPRVALTSPNSEGGRELAATAASVAAAGVEPTQPPSDDSQEDQHLGDGTVPWTAESSVLLRSGETGAGATSPASGPSWASQLPPLISRSDAPLAETWSVAAGLQGAEGIGVLSSSQEAGMEPALSSEDLPLIFEPFDDATTAGATATMPPRALAPAELATGTLTEADLERVVTMDADRVLSDIPPPGAGEWPSPWQMSGVEMAETVEPSRRPISTVYPGGPADHTGADITQNPPRTPPTSSATLSASVTQQSPMATVTKAAHFPAVRPKSGLEELESEEEEDEENEDIEDSEEEEDEEEESDEDLTDVPAPAPTRPPYSLIPPPPVWVQRNQGLARSWVELIREKAGYVSGMLAPVGIGIAGALLIVGALYSIRMIHRKRRNSFKHQRRKQPREVRTGQDQAMLLADSSEDEF